MAYANNLDQAIERLYTAFEGYRLPKHTNPCPCCHTAEDELKLHAQPLRQLDPDHLREYSGDALLVWGDVNLFKHLLPRVFELLAMLPDPFPMGTEAILRKLPLGEWRSWPSEEQEAVEAYLHAAWWRVLATPPENEEDIEGWLCGIGQCEDDLRPYLQEWIRDKRRSALLALSCFLLTSAVARNGTKGRLESWRGRDAQYAQLQEWVKSAAVIEKLRAAETRFADSEIAAELAMARAICSGPE
jgi:hypothetical protein